MHTTASSPPLPCSPTKPPSSAMMTVLLLLLMTVVSQTAGASSSDTSPWQGFRIAAPEHRAELQIRGLVQADGIFPVIDTAYDKSRFEARRARIALGGEVGKTFAFRIQPQWTPSGVALIDAYADIALLDGLELRLGKMKTPLGIEMRQSATALIMPERGLSTALVPNRDIGAQLNGRLGAEILLWSLGVGNGTHDQGRPGGNRNDDFDTYARLLIQPFHLMDGFPLRNLGIGLAGSMGWEEGDPEATGLGRCRTSSRAGFAEYAATVIADGLRWRFNPQLRWYWQSLGLLGEYVYSEQRTSLGGTIDSIGNHAWMAGLTYVLTGEDASYGRVWPMRSWGAIELALRLSQLFFDARAIERGFFVENTPQTAFSWAVGLNYWTNTIFRAQCAFEQTRFEAAPATGEAARSPESSLFLRAQISF